jgi:hypothetical protein
MRLDDFRSKNFNFFCFFLVNCQKSLLPQQKGRAGSARPSRGGFFTLRKQVLPPTAEIWLILSSLEPKNTPKFKGRSGTKTSIALSPECGYIMGLHGLFTQSSDGSGNRKIKKEV